MKYKKQIDKIILRALKEDIGSGDITTLATISANKKAKAEFIVKDNGVIAGLEVVERVFKIQDDKLKLTKYVTDGDEISSGKIIAEIEGKVSGILTAERTALNFLQRMSGIATLAKKYSDEVKHTKAKIIDTRKTVPGLRLVDKLAVTYGGCQNHRIGLYDMFLIKDNHIAAAGSITEAVKACRKFMKKRKKKINIEVETENLEQIKEAVAAGADIIMLDNFEIDKMKEAVEMINGQAKIEASGGITIETVKKVAETGVDFISVGALTHSVKALDISLEIKLNK